MRLLIVLMIGLLGIPALAHDPNLASITLRLEDDGMRASVALPASRAGSSPERRLVITEDSAPLRLDAGAPLTDAASGSVLVDLRKGWKSIPARLGIQSLYPEDPRSKTLVFIYVHGVLNAEETLDANRPSLDWRLDSAPTPPLTVARRFVREGVAHIFSGFDHICFVVGLLLLGGSLKQLLKVVTAFTIAHSITLCLAATGVFAPSPKLVEPLIALSIVTIGLENILVKPGERDIRVPLALGFGLLHGFGFAGALTEVGLPRQSLGIALASFNIGVEIGQATIVLLLAPILAWIAVRSPAVRRRVLVAGAVGISLLGAFWFFERILN